MILLMRDSTSLCTDVPPPSEGGGTSVHRLRFHKITLTRYRWKYECKQLKTLSCVKDVNLFPRTHPHQLSALVQFASIHPGLAYPLVLRIG